MKKFAIIVLFATLLCGCEQNNEDMVNPAPKVEGRTIYASFHDGKTKVYAQNYKTLHWHKGDEISFFDANTYNSKY